MPPRSSTFSYDAQTADGNAISGTIDAASIVEANNQFQSLQLRVTRLEQIDKPSKRAAFAADDFLAFNQQLAHLTAGGLPVERGLRLLANEMSNRRQKAAIDAVATELEKGACVGDAFAAHRRQFPPLYGRLIDAGIAANDLPGVLLNLGRHMTLVGRLRAALWRAGTYPIAVATALLVVLMFIWMCIIPQVDKLSRDMRLDTSRTFSTRMSPSSPSTPAMMFLPIAGAFSYIIMAMLAISLLTIAVFAIMTRSMAGRRLAEPLLLRIPLTGPILRLNLLARWCDALQMGVHAGLNLPASIGLACDAVDSPPLVRDGKLLIDALAAGRSLDAIDRPGILPPVIPSALQMACDQSDLPAATQMLATMYQEQSELKLAVLPSILSPLLLFLIALCVGVAVMAALIPLLSLLQWLSGPM